jgi:3-deoxy-D-manno-octulosonic-acid transferase
MSTIIGAEGQDFKDDEEILLTKSLDIDFIMRTVDLAQNPALREKLARKAREKVLAKYTWKEELKKFLPIYEKILKQFPHMILVIAPRHIERTSEIESLLERRGFEYQLRSNLDGHGTQRTKPVVIMNTFGELFKLYSVGTIVFCGASLVPLGGQNPFEAAVWGKVVFYGPSMEDFLDAKALLEEVGAGIPVSSPEMLAEKALWFLNHPDALKTSGERAREAVLRNRNAAEKHARVVANLI